MEISILVRWCLRWNDAGLEIARGSGWRSGSWERRIQGDVQERKLKVGIVDCSLNVLLPSLSTSEYLGLSGHAV